MYNFAAVAILRPMSPVTLCKLKLLDKQIYLKKIILMEVN